MVILCVLIYLSGLLAIMSLIVIGYTKYSKKHYISETVENMLGFILFIVIFAGGFIVMNKAKVQIEDELKNAQLMTCLRTRLSDDEYMTDEQCQFFQDVLGGKYADEIDYEPTDY